MKSIVNERIHAWYYLLLELDWGQHPFYSYLTFL
jgi:hypothetical protein